MIDPGSVTRALSIVVVVKVCIGLVACGGGKCDCAEADAASPQQSAAPVPSSSLATEALGAPAEALAAPAASENLPAACRDVLIWGARSKFTKLQKRDYHAVAHDMLCESTFEAERKQRSFALDLASQKIDLTASKKAKDFKEYSSTKCRDSFSKTDDDGLDLLVSEFVNRDALYLWRDCMQGGGLTTSFGPSPDESIPVGGSFYWSVLWRRPVPDTAPPKVKEFTFDSKVLRCQKPFVAGQVLLEGAPNMVQCTRLTEGETMLLLKTSQGDRAGFIPGVSKPSKTPATADCVKRMGYCAKCTFAIDGNQLTRGNWLSNYTCAGMRPGARVIVRHKGYVEVNDGPNGPQVTINLRPCDASGTCRLEKAWRPNTNECGNSSCETSLRSNATASETGEVAMSIGLEHCQGPSGGERSCKFTGGSNLTACDDALMKCD